MKAILEKGRNLATWLWSFMGDARTKNALLVILLLMTFFGIVAPETATSLRDTVVALAF